MTKHITLFTALFCTIYCIQGQNISGGAIVPMAATNTIGGGGYQLTHLIGQTFYTESNNIKSGAVFIESSSAPLPVSLLSFEVSFNPLQNASLITWTTATEINSDFFEVEKSTDGVHYQVIGIRKSAGNTNKVTHYNLIDPTPQYGINYYRLKQFDFDGSVEYFPAKLVLVPLAEEAVMAYPNPFEEVVFLKLPDDFAGEFDYELYNASGLLTTRGSLIGSSNALNLANLSSGLYYLILKVAPQPITIKINKL